jgi:hypothetical protein
MIDWLYKSDRTHIMVLEWTIFPNLRLSSLDSFGLARLLVFPEVNSLTSFQSGEYLMLPFSVSIVSCIIIFLAGLFCIP